MAGAIREFRKNAVNLLLEEANIECGLRDVIQSGGPSYRFTEKITVRDADDPVNDGNDSVNDPDDRANYPVNGRRDPVNGPVSEDSLSDRQRWALDQMRAGKPVRIGDIAEWQKCSKTTAKRDLTERPGFQLPTAIGYHYHAINRSTKATYRNSAPTKDRLSFWSWRFFQQPVRCSQRCRRAAGPGILAAARLWARAS